MKKLLKPLGALAFIALICLNPGQAAAAALSALISWATRVVPSLFPFFVAIPALTCPEARLLFRRLMKGFMAFMKCPADLAPALITGMLSGSPAGAVATVSAARGLTCGDTALLRCAVMASGASPAFMLSTVAVGMLGNAKIGGMLIGAQYLSALSVGFLMRFLPDGEARKISAQEDAAAVPVVLGAARNLVMIGGYMMLFSILARQLAVILGEAVEKPLLMLFELAGGCESAITLPLPPAQRIAAIAAIGCMGGVSVCAQCLSFLRPLGIKAGQYVFWKLVQTGLASLYALFMATFLLDGRPVSLEWAGSWPLIALCVVMLALGAAALIGRRARSKAA